MPAPRSFLTAVRHPSLHACYLLRAYIGARVRYGPSCWLRGLRPAAITPCLRDWCPVLLSSARTWTHRPPVHPASQNAPDADAHSSRGCDDGSPRAHHRRNPGVAGERNLLSCHDHMDATFTQCPPMPPSRRWFRPPRRGLRKLRTSALQPAPSPRARHRPTLRAARRLHAKRPGVRRRAPPAIPLSMQAQPGAPYNSAPLRWSAGEYASTQRPITAAMRGGRPRQRCFPPQFSPFGIPLSRLRRPRDYAGVIPPFIHRTHQRGKTAGGHSAAAQWRGPRRGGPDPTPLVWAAPRRPLGCRMPLRRLATPCATPLKGRARWSAIAGSRTRTAPPFMVGLRPCHLAFASPLRLGPLAGGRPRSFCGGARGRARGGACKTRVGVPPTPCNARAASPAALTTVGPPDSTTTSRSPSADAVHRQRDVRACGFATHAVLRTVFALHVRIHSVRDGGRRLPLSGTPHRRTQFPDFPPRTADVPDEATGPRPPPQTCAVTP